MLNLMRMDLRRLFISRSYPVMVLVTAIFTVGVICLLFLVAPSAPGVEPSKTPLGTITTAKIILEMMSGGGLLVIFAIFFCLFVMAEQQGYIKNIAGQLPHRGMLVLSKIPVALVMTLTLFLACTASALTATLLIGRADAIGDLAPIAAVSLLQPVAFLGFAALILWLSIALRNTAGAMMLALAFPVGFAATVYQGVNLLLIWIFGRLPFDVSAYSVEFASMTITGQQTPDQTVHAVLVAIGWILVCGAGAMLVLQKRDIR